MDTGYLSAERVHIFELLVEELVKTYPNEDQVRHLMQKLDLEYIKEPVDRISLVLEQMNRLVFENRTKGEQYDL